MANSVINLFAKRSVEAVEHVLGDMLAHDTKTAWWGLRASPHFRLDTDKPAALAYVALKSPKPEHAETALTVALARQGRDELENAT